MVSSGMLRGVALVRTDISEELRASFIRVTRIGELGTTLAVTSNRRTAVKTSNLTTIANTEASPLEMLPIAKSIIRKARWMVPTAIRGHLGLKFPPLHKVTQLPTV
jgi:hypothetical protein